MMTTLLNWGVENGRLQKHHRHGIQLLHSVDKSEEIWEARRSAPWLPLGGCGSVKRNQFTLPGPV